jgi:hypothetical protein
MRGEIGACHNYEADFLECQLRRINTLAHRRITGLPNSTVVGSAGLAAAGPAGGFRAAMLFSIPMA